MRCFDDFDLKNHDFWTPRHRWQVWLGKSTPGNRNRIFLDPGAESVDFWTPPGGRSVAPSRRLVTENGKNPV